MKNNAEKNPPRLIACDLDGTLLNDLAELTDANKQAIREITMCSSLFVPTSGRALYEITSEVRDLDSIRYLITSNGARVTDKNTGVSIETLISKEDFSSIINIMKDYEVYFSIHHEAMAFVDENLSSKEMLKYYRISDYYVDHIKKTCVKMPHFKEYFGTPRAVEMVCGFFRSENELEECMQRLSAYPSLFVTSSSKGSIEILSSKATKGNAILSLAAELGIDVADTVAVGDSLNDLTMITAAGLGLATKNAVSRLKEAADRVICSNEENVASYLKNELF